MGILYHPLFRRIVFRAGNRFAIRPLPLHSGIHQHHSLPIHWFGDSRIEFPSGLRVRGDRQELL
jgi:hypothetical protein